jgi:predicted HTH domain antitoxin
MLDYMSMVNLALPDDLVSIAKLDQGDISQETAKLIALGLFREDKVSLGRAAELCRIPIEAFMQFVAEHEVPLHYGVTELEERSPDDGTSWSVKVVADASPLISLPHRSSRSCPESFAFTPL